MRRNKDNKVLELATVLIGKENGSHTVREAIQSGKPYSTGSPYFILFYFIFQIH
jgi:hypothetical protein